MTTKPSNACQMPEEIYADEITQRNRIRQRTWDTEPYHNSVKYIRADLVEKMKDVVGGR